VLTHNFMYLFLCAQLSVITFLWNMFEQNNVKMSFLVKTSCLHGWLTAVWLSTLRLCDSVWLTRNMSWLWPRQGKGT